MKVHDLFIEQFTDMDRRPDRQAGPLRKIAVLSTPRCGSTFFCQALASTGLFGRPEEWLNDRRLEAYGRHRGVGRVDLQQYYEYVLNKSTTPNGIFTAKIHIDQYINWKKYGVDALEMNFDRILYIYRRDKLAQAYSYAKALETDQWTSFLEPQAGTSPGAPPGSAVARALSAIVAWEEYYADNLSRHVDQAYCYEDVLQDAGFVGRVLDGCSIENAGHFPLDLKIKVQRNDDDKAALERFRRYLSGLDE
jgi:LPS sulfotransferase NodH